MAEHNLSYSHKWPAAAAMALALASVSTSASAETTDATISEFLKSVMGSTDTDALLPSNVARQYIDANGIDKSQYQIIIDDNYAPFDTYFAIKDAYEAYCEARGGKLDPTSSANNRYLYKYYWNKLLQYDLPNNSGYQLFTAVCRNRTVKTWSAMAIVAADRVSLERRFEWSNVAPLHLKTFSTSTTVMAVTPNMFDQEMQDEILSLPEPEYKAGRSPVLSPLHDGQTRYLLQQREFQANLKVGDRTNCGKIIEMRGPLIKIKLPESVLFHNKSSVWINKDRLTNEPTVDCTNG